MAVRIQKGAALELIPLTPLIDVVFQLLIFFLVATRYEQTDRELDLPLPDASEARPLIVSPRELIINIDQDGSYHVDGKVVDLAALEAILAWAATNNPLHQSVMIRGHKRVAFDHVVQAINLCKKVGIRDYVANTQGD
jgi:biopolymer transport protein ExbD